MLVSALLLADIPSDVPCILEVGVFTCKIDTLTGRAERGCDVPQRTTLFCRLAPLPLGNGLEVGRYLNVSCMYKVDRMTITCLSSILDGYYTQRCLLCRVSSELMFRSTSWMFAF